MTKDDMTCTIGEELERLQRYLATQPDTLRVEVIEPIPLSRYIIPQSLLMIVQKVQSQHPTPLVITIRFLKYAVEISYSLQTQKTCEETFADLSDLVALYRQYFCLPSVRHADGQEIVSVPLFI